ncbi:hypothetical protein [Streptomyces orinoci]|uniref:Uncharacterized protein n=1 Tax=Streptomyces orinoci TaxID=67339 RepID=A0ABV3K3Q1_STRON|nr:hypothetical protein [Streptomyces orinoci]
MPPPSRGALFLRRVFTGDWAGSARVALWPLALLLTIALGLSIATGGSSSAPAWPDRFRLFIALLLQGLGGSLDIDATSPGGLVRGAGSVSVRLLTITVLWTVATVLGARRLRRARPAGGGLESALRTGLLCAAVVLALGLYGQPESDGVAISTTPALAALFVLALTAGTSAAVLCRDIWAARLGPGARMAVRAWGTALRALALSVALWAVIDFVFVAAHQEEVGGGWGVLASLAFLGNMAVLSLGLSFGADAEATATPGGGTGFSPYGTGGGWSRSATVGLDQIGEQWGVWAQLGVVAAGALCALSLTWLLVRRCRAGYREQLLSGAFFLAALWLLALASGISVELSGQVSFIPSLASELHLGNSHFGLDGGETLLFGALWTAGAVLLGVLIQSTRRPDPAPPAPPYGPPPSWHPAAPTASAPLPPTAPPTAPAAPPARPATSPTVPGAPPAAPARPPAPPAAAPGPGAPATPNAQPSANTAPPGPSSANATSTAGPFADMTPPAGPPLGKVPPTMPFAAHPTPGSTHSTPLGAPTPAPAKPVRARAPYLRWIAIGLAAFLVGGAGAAGVLLVQQHKDGKPHAATAVSAAPTPSTASTAAPAPTPPPTSPAPPPTPTPLQDKPTPPTGEPPAGYERMTSPEGFSLAVPRGWHREDKGSGQIDYAGPTGPEHLRIGILEHSTQSAYDHFLAMEKVVGKQQGYQRVGMTANTFQGHPGARWEWTWQDPGSGQAMRAMDQAYVGPDGTEYAILFQGRDHLGSDFGATFRTALAFWWVGPY